MRAILIVNPTARGGAFADVGAMLLQRLTQAGWDAELRVPVSPEDTRALIHGVRNTHDAVVVAGGDGTVGIAVQELAGATAALGVIPVGTGNDFAAAFGLHSLDVEASIATVIAGTIRMVDLGTVAASGMRPHPFATVLATGFDSLVNDRANRMRFPRGHSRYTISIFIEYLRLKRIAYRVSWTNVDGSTEESAGPYLMASVANTRSYGGGVPISPEADPADGALDLILIRPAGRIRLLFLLATVFKAQHLGEPEVLMRRITHARIEASGVRAYADGDAVSALPVDVAVLPAALRLFVPAP